MIWGCSEKYNFGINRVFVENDRVYQMNFVFFINYYDSNIV